MPVPAFSGKEAQADDRAGVQADALESGFRADGLLFDAHDSGGSWPKTARSSARSLVISCGRRNRLACARSDSLCGRAGTR
jgi:hypothetical protein